MSKKKIKDQVKIPAVAEYVRVGEKTIRTIQSELSICGFPQPLSKESLLRLKDLSEGYLADREIIDNLPRPSLVREKLKDLKEKSGDLLNSIERLDIKTRQVLKKQSDWCVDLDLSNNFIQKVRMLHFASESALDDLTKDRGGPNKKNTALEIYISGLMEIFRNETGKNPGINSEYGRFYGPFFRFVETCLTEIDVPPFSNTALGSTIQRTLKLVQESGSLSQDLLKQR
ncbi:MAG: hypothetical protein HF978_01625 [Desulfobacteraceae bacterium]|nr:hypothetical protein [Desulfobacteraceae bacterium]MBC2754224.1 hypothetical protein [Desulfobacteraceae bacterium]